MDSGTNNIDKDNNQRKTLLLARVGILAYLIFCLLLYFLGCWISGEWKSKISVFFVILIVLSFPLIEKYLTLLLLIAAAVMALSLTYIVI